MDQACVTQRGLKCQDCQRDLVKGEAAFRHLIYYWFCMKCARGKTAEDLKRLSLPRR